MAAVPIDNQFWKTIVVVGVAMILLLPAGGLTVIYIHQLKWWHAGFIGGTIGVFLYVLVCWARGVKP